MKQTMKKLIMLSVIALCSSISYAQVGLGVRAGVNMSSLPTKLESSGVSVKADDMSGLTRFYVGALVDVPFTWRWHMQTGVDFSWQGGKASGDKMRSTQIQIPALAKMYVIERMPVLLGVYGSYAISNKIEIEGEKYSLDDLYHKWDFGMQAGVAYEFDFGMFAEFRYMRGFLNLAKNEATQNGVKIKMHNQTFQIGVGFRM